jgi:hypothetical protein
VKQFAEDLILDIVRSCPQKAVDMLPLTKGCELSFLLLDVLPQEDKMTK